MKHLEMKCNQCGYVFGMLYIEEESYIAEIHISCPKDDCSGDYSI